MKAKMQTNTEISGKCWQSLKPDKLADKYYRKSHGLMPYDIRTKRRGIAGKAAIPLLFSGISRFY